MSSLAAAVLALINENKETGKAAIVLIIKDGKAFCVSRGDSDMWGLPGGKVEPGETWAEGATRELFEETGLTLTNAREVYRAQSTGGYETATFVGDVTGKAQKSDEGRLAWKDVSTLLDAETSPFWKYTTDMLAQLED